MLLPGVPARRGGWLFAPGVVVRTAPYHPMLSSYACPRQLRSGTDLKRTMPPAFKVDFGACKTPGSTPPSNSTYPSRIRENIGGNRWRRVHFWALTLLAVMCGRWRRVRFWARSRGGWQLTARNSSAPA
eukprot:316484-Rhodomonas_salina.1